ncbi:MAG: hypothetical protein JWQ38_2168 [Flavipsychrobacter sp.]|nr:hypothetical protein [Flavipsychrobacter sp.]
MKLVTCFIVAVFFYSGSYAQIPDGSVAHDFTFTDINGTTQNLYTYLDQGKHVIIDVSATWCNPCWQYHNSHVMDSLYSKHDTPGDNTWKVFFIEGDNNTTTDQLNGIGTTQGNWVAGTPFPMMDPSGAALNDFLSYYNVTAYPTLYMICPDRKIYSDTLNKGNKPSVATWEYVANMCSPVSVTTIEESALLHLYPNPATGCMNIAMQLKTATDVTVTVTDIAGSTANQKTFSNLNSGANSLQYDVSKLRAGMYIATITTGNGSCEKRKIMIQ